MAYIFKPDSEGSHLTGIPARSLSDEEYAALTPEQQEAVKHSRLYEAAEDAAPASDAAPLSLAADLPAAAEDMPPTP